MGTSTNYSAPGSWGPLKREVTVAAATGRVSPATAGRIISHFIQHNGGAARIAAGGSGGTIGGSAGRAIAQRLGNFITAVGEAGLPEALRREGLLHLVGRPIQQILAALLDHLGGPASTIDDVDARTALAHFQEELLRDAQTPDDIERILQDRATNLDVILRDYFGLYLFEQFCRVFFERLVQKRGESLALGFLDDIKEFINAMLVSHVRPRALARISWTGQEGATFCADIMQETLAVFLT